MNYLVKIAFLHLMLLASQAIYMYVSNTAQLISRRFQYIAWMPLVVGLPTILYSQSADSYYLYEYAVVICMITAAISDTVYAALTNREYLTDETVRRFRYSYFLICIVSVFSGGINIWIKAFVTLILAGTLYISHMVIRRPVAEFFKSIPLAMFSLACAWLL